jgi:hypothetical protein
MKYFLLGTAVVVVVLLAVWACAPLDSSQPVDQSGIEVDIDHPKAKKPKAPAKPKPAPKAKSGSKR